MENIQLLIEAMEYIEDNLSQPLKTDTIADHLYCSKSTILYDVFYYPHLF